MDLLVELKEMPGDVSFISGRNGISSSDTGLDNFCLHRTDVIGKGINPFLPKGQMEDYSLLPGHQLWINCRIFNLLCCKQSD